jgi:anti-sigma-K factor RskA
MTSHDHFAELLAAYAVDALDRSERAAFEVHLATCAECQQELVDLRRVTAGIGLGVPREEPPVSLRARVLARAAADADTWRAAPAGAAVPPTTSRIPWLVAAASLIIAVGAGLYAYGLRNELRIVRQLAADATERVDTLRTELMRLRQDSSRLQQVVSIINAPDVRQARLAGMNSAPDATGLALWSQATGLVFNARRMPPVDPGRGYELWAIPPGGKPISLGMLTASPDGTISSTATIPAAVDVETVAVTIEQAGGSPTGQPLGTIVLAGKIAG